MRWIGISCLIFLKLCGSDFFYFIPPKNWEVIDPSNLPSTTTVAFIYKGNKTFKPSVNLGIESTNVSLETYLTKAKKRVLLDRKNHWKDLSYIDTPFGIAHLTQIEQKHECGEVISLQYIIIHEKKAYVITGVCLKEDFSESSKTFLDVFESFKITQNALSSLSDLNEQEELKKAKTEVEKSWEALIKSSKKTDLETLFNSKKFQKNSWRPFEKRVAKSFKNKGLFWQSQTAYELKKTLINNI